MPIGTRAKRLTYLVHRWTGVAGCLLMALWFVSGVVMLYVGYPKLTPWERLGALPVLDARQCCAPPDSLTGGLSAPEAGALLTSIGGHPYYVVHDSQHGPRRLDARTGQPGAAITPEAALTAARHHAPTARPRYLETLHEDRWTHARGLDAHRPLHRIQLDGDRPGLLYVSSATGQVVMDVPRAQQYWNYVGAWLHWLYLFRSSSVDPAWSWLVIVLSAVCTVTALTGVAAGLWRWRFQGRYKSGRKTPYQEGWMRWHHLTGLIFSAIVCTWIFSGLMSMNPFGVFAAASPGPDLAAYRGEAGATPDALNQPAHLIQALRRADFQPVELHWQRMNGEAYVLAYDQQARSRVIRTTPEGQIKVLQTWPADAVLPAARRLFDAPMDTHQVIAQEEAYYYQRHPEAMNGGRLHGLPALRVDFADAGQTRVYVDLNTGAVTLSLDRAQRVGRWLFYFLHSWDTPALLRGGVVRDAVLILLSIGGLAVSVTGVVIGWRRLRLKSARRPQPR